MADRNPVLQLYCRVVDHVRVHCIETRAISPRPFSGPSKWHQRGSEETQETRASMDGGGQSRTDNEPSPPTFRTSFTTRIPSSDSVNSLSTNDAVWIERLARSPLSSVTQRLPEPNKGKSLPGGLRTLRATTPLHLKQILKKDRKLKNKINTAQRENVRPESSHD
ncbi:hypothetical protein CPC08DRAFT_438704 [Agrocybe pediades]|nr:hypothetical protein CPC08DRAFT_438704 [Agrocybe pediades]